MDNRNFYFKKCPKVIRWIMDLCDILPGSSLLVISSAFVRGYHPPPPTLEELHPLTGGEHEQLHAAEARGRQTGNFGRMTRGKIMFFFFFQTGRYVRYVTFPLGRGTWTLLLQSRLNNK